MESSFSNGTGRFGRLNSYLQQTRRSIARVRKATTGTIRQTESDLSQIHVDGAPSGLLRLLREMDASSGIEDISDNSNINQNVKDVTQGNGANHDRTLFRLSQRQIWSNFAREITKSLKRNL